MILTSFLCFLCRLPGQDADRYTQKLEVYLKQADSLQENGQLTQAVFLFEELQRNYKETENWEGYVRCLVKTADFMEDEATLEKRRQLLTKSIEVGRQHLPPGHQHLLEALRSKGEYHIDMGQLDSAGLLLAEAIELGETSENWEELTWALIIKAVVDYYQDDFVGMETAIDSARSIAETRIAAPAAHFEMILQLEAILFDATGNYEKAFIAAQRNLKRKKEKPITERHDSLSLANSYNTQGAIYYERGDYDQAIHHYKIALDLHQKVKSEVGTLVGVNNNIALSYKQKTDQKQTLFYLRASKSLLPEKPNDANYRDWIRTHQLIASNLVEQENFETAILLLEELLPLGDQYGFNENWNHRAMGTILLRENQPKEARYHFKKSLQAAKKIYGLLHPEIAEINRRIGKSFLDQNELDSALHYFQKALLRLSPDFTDSLHFSNPDPEQIAALTKFLPILASKATALVRLSESEPRWEPLALATYRQAIATIDRMREHHETEEAKLLLSTSAKEIYEGSIQLLHQRYAKSRDTSLLAEAFHYAEKSKSLLLLEMIRSAKAREAVNPLYAGDTLFNNLLNKGKNIKTELLFFEEKLAEAQQGKNDSEGTKVKNAEAALARLYEEDLEWKARIKKDYPAYYDLQYDQSFVDVATVQYKMQGAHTAFLEYFIGKRASYLFVISREGVKFLQIPGHDELQVAIQQLQTQLLDPSSSLKDAQLAYGNYNQAAFQAYRLLLQEALQALPTTITKLTIVPDGMLNSVPFEALTTSLKEANIDFGTLPYLLNDYQLHYGYSATLLLFNQDRYDEVPANINCLALAPPYQEQEDNRGRAFNTRNNNGSLSGTVDEIQHISKYFPGEYDVSEKATEAFFKQKAAHFGLLHLAMHGVADYDNANFAHLKFTNLSNDTLEDNLLHHYEIADMHFSAQMATLSACETGLGKYEEGEGVFSLARSFMYAGVPSVVMSLWKIDDQSTGQLMPLFYKNLAAGLTKDGALQKAKQGFMQTADLEYKHPYYWSGMVLLGDEQCLKRQVFSLWFWGLLPLLLVAFFFFYKKNQKAR